MFRTADWRRAQAQRWIARRQYLYRVTRNTPERVVRQEPPREPIDWEAEEWPAWFTLNKARPDEWTVTQAHRLDKHTFSCECRMCRIDVAERRFRTHKDQFYRQLDRHEAEKW